MWSVTFRLIFKMYLFVAVVVKSVRGQVCPSSLHLYPMNPEQSLLIAASPQVNRVEVVAVLIRN